MIKGTTPTHHFELPFEASRVAAARVIYKQGNIEVLRKETEDFKKDGNRISVTFSQDETFLFDSRISVKCQLRVRDISDKVMNTKPMIISIEECLDCEVL